MEDVAAAETEVLAERDRLYGKRSALSGNRRDADAREMPVTDRSAHGLCFSWLAEPSSGPGSGWCMPLPAVDPE